MGDFEAPVTKTDNFCENLEDNVLKFWNQTEPDVINYLYENYSDRLLDVTKAKVLMTRYYRTNLDSKFCII